MAPRQSIRARAAKATKPSTSTSTTASHRPSSTATTADDSTYASAFTDSAFPTTKKDKQRIKHSLLLSKVSKSAPGAAKKRRRPNKQLVANLEGLADALPDADALDAGAGGVGGLGGRAEGVDVLGGQARVVLGQKGAGLKSRPGAMKRKEVMERRERERFGMNLARIQAGQGQQAGQQSQQVESGTGAAGAAVAPAADRWAALRGFIQGTMERKEEFRSG